MRIVTTRPFEKDYAALPNDIKALASRKLRLFLRTPRHPSLRVKKMHDPREIWEGSITKSYRFTFQIEKDVYILRRIGPHDILSTP